MDSLTQLTLGAAMGEACLGRRIGSRAALAGAVLGTLPDLDSFIPYGSALASFTYHRSFSHSLLVLALLSPVAAWLAMKLLRQPEELWRRWWLLAALALLTHPLLDTFTVYGTQLLWPLSDHPFSGSAIFIIDPLYTLVLALGLLIALTLSRRTRKRTWVNLGGVALSSLYLLWGVYGRFQVEGDMRALLEESDIPYQRLLATPAPLNTLLWRVVVIAEDGYYEAFYPILEGREGLVMGFHPDDKHLLETLAGHWPVERLRWFSHGFYSVRQRDGEVLMADLRMGMEPNYVFTFRVGRIKPEGVVPAEDAMRPSTWDGEQIMAVLRRAGQSLGLGGGS